MLLAFDIGNTNIVVGCFDGEELFFEFRLKSDRRGTVDEYAAFVRALLRERGGKDFKCDQAIISSVVPPLTPLFITLLERTFGVEPLVVGPGVKTGLSIKTTDPSAVGADRVVNAVAAKQFYGLPALAIDFGTAISFDYVDKDSNYLGGIIVPGLEISLDALVSNTAKLPRVEQAWPASVIGRNTIGAMQSGAVIGYHCLVDGLIEKIVEEVGPIPYVIATGGSGKLIASHSKRIKEYDPYLILKGMRYLVELNREA